MAIEQERKTTTPGKGRNFEGDPLTTKKERHSSRAAYMNRDLGDPDEFFTALGEFLADFEQQLFGEEERGNGGANPTS